MQPERRIARVTYFVEPTPRYALGVDAFMSPATAIDVAWEFTDDADRQLGLDGALTRYVKANKNCMSPRKSKPISDAARAEFYRKSAGSSAYEVWTRVSTSGVRFSVLVEFDETSEIRRVLSDPFLDRFDCLADVDLSNLGKKADAMSRNSRLNATDEGGKVSSANVPALLQRLYAQDPAVRRATIRELIDRQATSAVPRLVERLKDSDEFVRVEAAKALGAMGEPWVIPALRSAGRASNADLEQHFDAAVFEITERHGTEEERQRRAEQEEQIRQQQILRVEEEARRRREQSEKDRRFVEERQRTHEADKAARRARIEGAGSSRLSLQRIGYLALFNLLFFSLHSLHLVEAPPELGQHVSEATGGTFAQWYADFKGWLASSPLSGPYLLLLLLGPAWAVCFFVYAALHVCFGVIVLKLSPWTPFRWAFTRRDRIGLVGARLWLSELVAYLKIAGIVFLIVVVLAIMEWANGATR